MTVNDLYRFAIEKATELDPRGPEELARHHAHIATYRKDGGFRLHGRLFDEELQLKTKERYRMKDVCRMLNVTESTVKAWERRGWFPKPRREPQSNHRIYSDEEMALLKRNFTLRARRFKGKGGGVAGS